MTGTPETRKPDKVSITAFRDKQGGMSDELKAYVKTQNRLRKAVTTSLKAGNCTVPEIASQHGLNTADVMWTLMAMKRYGKVVEAEQKGDYFTYRLKEVT